VPRLTGRALARAARLLASAHCRLGHVARVRAMPRNPVVVSQRPRAGTHLRAGGRVNVSLGARRTRGG
jgi:beta-lactam-binding protein with PASTA domain